MNAIRHPGVLFEEGYRPLPGAVELDGLARKQQFVRRNIETTPLGRLGQPREIGAAVVSLASDAAAEVTGIELTVDGGRMAGEFATRHGVPSQH